MQQDGEVADLLRSADSAKVTTNLWGERWSKLVANCMQNGLSACTGLSGNEATETGARCPFTAMMPAGEGAPDARHVQAGEPAPVRWTACDPGRS